MADALSVAPRVDGVVLVVSATKTKKSELEEAVQSLRLAGGTILGVVLNRTIARKVSQYPDYGSLETPGPNRAAGAGAIDPLRFSNGEDGLVPDVSMSEGEPVSVDELLGVFDDESEIVDRATTTQPFDELDLVGELDLEGGDTSQAYGVAEEVDESGDEYETIEAGDELVLTEEASAVLVNGHESGDAANSETGVFEVHDLPDA